MVLGFNLQHERTSFPWISNITKLFPGNNCLFERNVVIKIERAWTIGKKLPQDAINPAHGSLLRVNSPSHGIFSFNFTVTLFSCSYFCSPFSLPVLCTHLTLGLIISSLFFTNPFILTLRNISLLVKIRS